MTVLQFAGGFAFFCTLLIAWAVLTNAPLLAGLALFRRKVSPGFARLLSACGFGFSAIWLGYYFDYSDVWRHGIPSLTYILQAYVSYGLIIGAAGWAIGALIVRKEKPRAALPARG